MPEPFGGINPLRGRWIADARSLALMRIGVFLSIALLTMSPSSDVFWYLSSPRELAVDYPWRLIGWGPLTGNPIFARTVQIASILFSLLACFGYRTRRTSLAATLTAFYVLGIPHYFGKIFHYHHLLWFAAVLCVSPCADAWSWDARGSRSLRAVGPSARYGLPLAVCGILTGILYFFPGVWKVATQGLGWFTGEPLRMILIDGWERYGFIPPVRIDRHPLWLMLSAAGVVVFETGFIFMFLSGQRTRRCAIAAALIFHAVTWIFMRITFISLILCYPALWGLRNAPASSPENRGTANRPLMVAAVVLIAGNLAFGAAGVNSWPFACYPRFDLRPPLYKKRIHIEAALADGRNITPRYEVLERKMKPARLDELRLRIASGSDPQTRARLARAFYTLIASSDARMREASSIRAYIETTRLDPDLGWPARKRLIGRWGTNDHPNRSVPVRASSGS